MPAGKAADPHALTQALKAEARRLGFTLVGVTTPDPPAGGQVFLDWLAQGRHGEMAYLEAESSRRRRLDPRLILPECKSILVLGLPYLPAGLVDTPLPAGKGRLASYAWGQDYHDLIPSHLQSLVHFLEDQVGATLPNRYYTDTGPLLERELAQRAGLGWIGKNTCLIHPQQGSYFFLAEILLGIDLEIDPPFTSDRCGSCTRCLEACPTGCILPDRTLDARRCISYLTIELKGDIPLKLRSQQGDWLFGCDVCQQVCPWNMRFSSSEAVPQDFYPASEDPHLDLAGLFALTPQDFNRRFKGTALRRAKRRGLLRDASVALGNKASGLGNFAHPEAVNLLGRALLQDPEPLVRGHAAWALGCIAGDLARSLLLQALAQEQDENTRLEIRQALQEEA